MEKFSVNVLGTTYGVELGDRKEVGLTHDLEGTCYKYQKRIAINTGGNEHLDLTETECEHMTRLYNTAAHEVFHAFVAESGLYLSDDLEESLATWYETHWQKLHTTVLAITERME